MQGMSFDALARNPGSGFSDAVVCRSGRGFRMALLAALMRGILDVMLNPFVCRAVVTSAGDRSGAVSSAMLH